MDETLSWITLAAASSLAAPYVQWSVTNRVNERMFGKHIEKLLNAGQMSRAHKLTACADMPVLRATRSVLETLRLGVASAPSVPDDYRSSAAVQDPANIRATLSATFVRGLDAARRPLRGRRWLASGGAALFVSVLATRIASQNADLPLLIACVALVVLAGCARIDFRQRPAALAMYAQLEDALVNAALKPTETETDDPLLREARARAQTHAKSDS